MSAPEAQAGQEWLGMNRTSHHGPWNSDQAKQIDLLLARNEALRAAFRDCISAFSVTLMVLDERANGEQDADKRYEFADKHPEIIAARAALAQTKGAA